MFLIVLTSLKIGWPGDSSRSHGWVVKDGSASIPILQGEPSRSIPLSRRIPAPYSIPCSPIATSSIADAAESRKTVTAQTTTNAAIMSGLVSR